MAIQSLSSGSGRVVSPVKCAKATVEQIAKVREVLARHGNTPPMNYEADWVGRAYAGAISTKGLMRAYAGDNKVMRQEGMASGVYRWHNEKQRKALNAPEQPQPLGRFDGLDDLNTFLKANKAEQDKYLKANGIVA